MATVRCPACQRDVTIYPERQMYDHRPYKDKRKAPPEQWGVSCLGSGRTVELTERVMADGKTS